MAGIIPYCCCSPPTTCPTNCDTCNANLILTIVSDGLCIPSQTIPFVLVSPCRWIGTGGIELICGEVNCIPGQIDDCQDYEGLAYAGWTMDIPIPFTFDCPGGFQSCWDCHGGSVAPCFTGGGSLSLLSDTPFSRCPYGTFSVICIHSTSCCNSAIMTFSIDPA